MENIVSFLREFWQKLRRPKIPSLMTPFKKKRKKEVHITSFYDLNEDCYVQIARMLDLFDRRRLSQTCQTFRNILRERAAPSLEIRKKVEYVRFVMDPSTPFCVSRNSCYRDSEGTHNFITFEESGKKNLANTAFHSYLSGRENTYKEVVGEMCLFWCGSEVILRCDEPLPDNTVYTQSMDQLTTITKQLFSNFRQLSLLEVSVYRFNYLFSRVNKLIAAFLRSKTERLQVNARDKSEKDEFLKRALRVVIRRNWIVHAEITEERCGYNLWTVLPLTRGKRRKFLVVPPKTRWSTDACDLG